MIAEWSTEFGHHAVDGADVHDDPPHLVHPFVLNGVRLFVSDRVRPRSVYR